MDAVRLIEASRHALAHSQDVPDIMTEVWQAQILAQAIGSRIAVNGPPELRGAALGLTESGGRGSGVLDAPMPAFGVLRAAQLSRIDDMRAALSDLGGLLGEIGIALVGVACAVDEEGLYWSVVEAIDAADESRDRVLEMLRRLTLREENTPEPDPAAGP